MNSKVHRFNAHAAERQRNKIGLDVLGDGLLLFVLFAFWLWQFESSGKGSLYHFILAAIGFVCLIGVGVLLAVILVSTLSSGRAAKESESCPL